MTQRYNLPAQNLSFEIPEIGEVFTTAGGGIWKRTGETEISYLDEDAIAKTDLKIGDTIVRKGESIQGIKGNSVPWNMSTNSPDRAFRGAHSQATSGVNKFNNSYSQNDLKEYLLGDINSGLSRIYGKGVTQSKNADTSFFTPTEVADSGEVFTQGVNSLNRHDFTVTSNKTGVVKGETPGSALAQQAAASGLQTDPSQTNAPSSSGGLAVATAQPFASKRLEGGQVVQSGGQLPSSNLGPGARGEEVEALQRYLVSQGFMSQQQMDTGPGIYGPQTTQAVVDLQNSLGIDNSSGPGYFGPLTRGAIGQSGGGFQADDPEDFRGMIEGVMESLVGSGKIIHPDITVDQLADINIADFLAQAEAEIAPEYKQKFDAVKSDLSTFFERTGVDLGLARDSVNRESDAVQLEADESFAGRGLAFSSRRNTFDGNLDSATDRSLSALDRGASRDAIDKGTAAERLIGTENLRGLSIPKIGEQRFALSTEPVIGSLQREKQFTKEGIAKQLEFDERARRAFSSRNLSFA